MAFDWAALKAQARRTVHRTFGLAAEYMADDEAAPVLLSVRWHNKLTTVGDPNGEGYAVSIDTIDKVLFDVEELAAKNVTIVRGARVKILAPGFGGQLLAIDTRDPKCGPSESVWHVGKLNSGEQYP
jgi:hypothetical protein